MKVFLSLSFVAVFIYCWLGPEFSLHPSWSQLFWEIRLPRLLCGLAAGLCMGVSGVLIQSYFGNPLASPGVTGSLSAGALATALSQLVLPVGVISSVLTSLCGFIATLSHGVGLSALSMRLSKHRLLLSGVMSATIYSSLLSALIFLWPDSRDKAAALMQWLYGDLSAGTYSEALYMFVPGFTIWGLASIYNKAIDALAMDGMSAKVRGLNTGFISKGIIIGSAISMAASLSATGPLPFVGLLVPHFGRQLGFVAHKKLLHFSAVFGALAVALSDIFTQYIVYPRELSAGIVLALVGAPLFISLIWKGGSND